MQVWGLSPAREPEPVTQGLPVMSPRLGMGGLGLRDCSEGQVPLVFFHQRQTPLLTCLIVNQFL